ncbi:MAG TPA: TIGR04563 family protein [Myxococcota bacterium]|nr:TIGR04563 family protein [Myxococcota bacterium]
MEKTADKRKQSLYFPEEMLTDIKREALRQDRSLSWIVQQAWRLARDDIKKFPSINLDSDEVDE